MLLLVKITVTGLENNANLMISDLSGKKIYQGIVLPVSKEAEEELVLNYLPKGVYIINLNSSLETIQKKIYVN